ncbi:MAG: ATPase, partial [Gaiellaceae bacterium]
MTTPVILAVDGGNSKTDLALVRADGSLLSLVRGPGSSPHHLGLEGGLTVLGTLLDEAARDLELPVAAAELLMAGVDFPVEEENLREAVLARGWATRVTVRNDTFAILRAGTDRGWG